MAASMGHDNMNDPYPATDGISRRRPWRAFAMAGVAGAALAVLLGFSGEERDGSYPPGALADYMPEDSEALLFVDVRSLRESPIGWLHLRPTLQQLLGSVQGRLPWLDALGINPFDDLDTLQISFAPGAGGQPLWLTRGRLDRSRLQTAAGKLQATTLDRFPVWECADRSTKRTTVLARVGDALVVGETRGRVLAALKEASDPRRIEVRDATLRELLTKVDRRQSLWLAASVAGLGPLGEIKGLGLLRPLLGHADSVHGGITCADDLRAELHFHAVSDEDAARLETTLKSIRETAATPGAAWLLGIPKELLPLLRLIGTGKISRKGKAILLRCRLTADQL
jgi:hypothetical protein